MIREFTPMDVNQMVDCAERHCQEVGEGIGTFNKPKLIEFIRQLNIKRGYKMFVAERGTTIKGYVVCSAYVNPWNGVTEGMIHFLYVDPEHRQGFMAKDLFAAAESYFRSCDCKFFNATTRAYDHQYNANAEYIKQGDAFFSRLMTDCGKNYIKEVI